MIKPRRVGHATFQTPDLEKAIAYYEKFMGLIVAEREKDRAFLMSKRSEAAGAVRPDPAAPFLLTILAGHRAGLAR